MITDFTPSQDGTIGTRFTLLFETSRKLDKINETIVFKIVGMI